MPEPLIKRGAKPGKMFGVKSSCRAAIPGGGEWPGHAVQIDPVSNATEVAAGGWAGSVLVTTCRFELHPIDWWPV